MKMRYFGFLPKLPKNLMEPLPFSKMPLPGELGLSCCRHEVKVQVGDKVAAGDVVAEGLDAGTEEIIAPVSGTVKSVIERYDCEGIKGKEVVLGDLQESAISRKEDPNYLKLGRDEILSKLKKLGVRCSVSEDDIVIVNAVDTEPTTNFNRCVLKERKDLVPSICKLAGILTGAEKIYLALPASPAIEIPQGVEGVTIDTTYPNTLPEMINDKITGYLDGAENISVLDLVNMVEALSSGVPLTAKLVNVIDKSGNIAGNILAPLGTRFKDILDHCEIALQPGDKLIAGGIMKGFPQYEADVPISANVNAITVVDSADNVDYSATPCINCGKCVRICPTKLQPNLIARYANYGFLEDMERHGIFSCIECGLCAVTCMSRRPLVQMIKHGKSLILKEKEKFANVEENA